jgi:hypothetical protein
MHLEAGQTEGVILLLLVQEHWVEVSTVGRREVLGSKPEELVVVVLVVVLAKVLLVRLHH